MADKPKLARKQAMHAESVASQVLAILRKDGPMMRMDICLLLDRDINDWSVSEALTHALKVDFWDIDEMANKIVAVLRHPPLSNTLREHGAFELQRLTWSGIALHAGALPGYPASHGCIRLPETFARKLFEVTVNGMLVVVADQASPAPALATPGFFAPIDPLTGSPRGRRYSPPQRYHLNPELAPAGPISVLISSSDAAVVVIRNGVEIGRARIDNDPGTRFGLHGFVMLERLPGVCHEVPAALRQRLVGRWQAMSDQELGTTWCQYLFRKQ